jgi:hypothetical protein
MVNRGQGKSLVVALLITVVVALTIAIDVSRWMSRWVLLLAHGQVYNLRTG